MLRATTACNFSTSQLPKVVRIWCVLYILTWKCASRHNGVHVFYISTAKSGPHLVCFVHFDLEMHFAPQRRALFHISTAKSGPHLVCFVHFDLEMCFAPQRVQFFISHLASWLRTRRFSEPTFRPSGAPNHWKNTVFRDFPTFSRICVFFLLTLLSSNLSLLSASSLLCFSSVHIVGSLTSKLPSIIHIYIYIYYYYYYFIYFLCFLCSTLFNRAPVVFLIQCPLTDWMPVEVHATHRPSGSPWPSPWIRPMVLATGEPGNELPEDEDA